MLKKFIRMLVRGMLLGIVLAAVLFLTDPSLHLSLWGLYNQVELGMDRQQVIHALGGRELWCGIEPPNAASSVCRFSDFFRTYQIIFDSKADRVVVKRFYFIRHKLRLTRKA